MSTAPFSEDALNRYRITHPDRDLKPLIRRLHRLPTLASSASSDETVAERQITQLELLKWSAGVGRLMGSVGNLGRQKESWQKQAAETRSKAEAAKEILAKEKDELARVKRLREHQERCDAIAASIAARGKGRAELDEEIKELEASYEEHQASHAVFLQTAQSRIDMFAQVTKLISECRDIKLPADASLNSVQATFVEEKKMDVDVPAVTVSAAPVSASSSKLSPSAAPFQPPSSLPAPPSSSSTLQAPPPGHSLPSRPAASPLASGNTRASSNQGSRPTSHSLPNRPPSGRQPAGKSGSRNGLEDGEVGEDGEMSDRSSKRAHEGESNRRSTRRRM
ncbi:hypothetical protein IAT38_003621 [Cryptococcus sp. DSM 104549]